MLPSARDRVLGKIAADVDRAVAWRSARGEPGRASGTPLARGNGWSVSDVLCTSGPDDRAFEEKHSDVSISIVVAGTFQYRSTFGPALMTPGSVLLGNPNQSFECGHEHATGDRCVSFNFSADYYERIAADAGIPRGGRQFRVSRLPPARQSAALVARASLAISVKAEAGWEDLAIGVAGAVARLAAGELDARPMAAATAVSRVTGSVRRIERHPGACWTLQQLAADAVQSPYHYLRTFQQLTGVTPHQFILRARLRDAAMRLAVDHAKVIDVAFDSGFGDVSNFNRAFRLEFGIAPRAYRKAAGV